MIYKSAEFFLPHNPVYSLIPCCRGVYSRVSRTSTVLFVGSKSTFKWNMTAQLINYSQERLFDKSNHQFFYYLSCSNFHHAYVLLIIGHIDPLNYTNFMFFSVYLCSFCIITPSNTRCIHLFLTPHVLSPGSKNIFIFKKIC